MHLRSFRRAASLALAGLLAFAGVASADFVRADGDTIEPGSQTFVDFGTVAPSAHITVPVDFTLVCGHLSHVDAGQTVTVALDSATAPLDGGIIGSTPGTVGPVPADWIVDGEGCPDVPPTVETGTLGSITLRAPSVVGTGYVYTTLWNRAVSPVGENDGSAFNRSSTGLSFTLEVVANTPPVLAVPADQTVEGDTTGGWTAAYTATASDTEDDPDPTPTCDPAPGSVLPLGTTTVSCAVTDAGGLGDQASFAVTVVDTTAPILAGVPGDRSVTTGSSAGTVVTWTGPTAADIVDATPSVACLPASGSTFAVGSTTVTCTATDDSGNTASGSFVVRVTHVPPVTAAAAWHEPLADGGGTFAANRGRTVPVKVSLSVNGVNRTSGDAALRLTPCAGDAGVVGPLVMTYGGGRWNVSLDTSDLAGACYTVTASIDGIDAGSFQLELRGAEALKAKAPGRPR